MINFEINAFEMRELMGVLEWCKLVKFYNWITRDEQLTEKRHIWHSNEAIGSLCGFAAWIECEQIRTDIEIRIIYLFYLW